MTVIQFRNNWFVSFGDAFWIWPCDPCEDLCD